MKIAPIRVLKWFGGEPYVIEFWGRDALGVVDKEPPWEQLDLFDSPPVGCHDGPGGPPQGN